jgi:hypothetical protein
MLLRYRKVKLRCSTFLFNSAEALFCVFHLHSLTDNDSAQEYYIDISCPNSPSSGLSNGAAVAIAIIFILLLVSSGVAIFKYRQYKIEKQMRKFHEDKYKIFNQE